MTSSILRIPCYMFDCNARLRPSSFMDIAQDLAGIDSEVSGFSDADLLSEGLVWILARMEVRFDNAPRRYDSVQQKTWHRGVHGLYFLRDYQLLSMDGSPAVSSTSSWVVMDKSTRRVVRIGPDTPLLNRPAESDEASMSSDAQKIVIPPEATLVGTSVHEVVYSDLDYNSHVNNAKYVLWAFDALPLEVAGNMNSFGINFNREAHLGESVQLLHYQMGDTHFIEGQVSGLKAFILRVC